MAHKYCPPNTQKPMAKNPTSAPKKKVLAMAKKGPKKMK